MARMSAPAQTFTGSNVNGSLSPMVLAISQTMNQTTVIDLPPSAVVSRGRSAPAPRARSSRREAERRVLVAHEQRVRRHAEAPPGRPDDDVEDIAWVAAREQQDEAADDGEHDGEPAQDVRDDELRDREQPLHEHEPPRHVLRILDGEDP